MIDRRFLDIRITIQEFISNLSGKDINGNQYILSADLNDNTYPNAKKDCIAIYNYDNGGWEFIKPKAYTSCEVINLSTGEILKYNGNDWQVIGYSGAYVLPYVVDKVFSSHADAIAQNRIGLTYILTGVDNYAYKVTGTGSSDYTKLVGNAVTAGKKVGVIEGARLYTAVSKDNTVQFDSNCEYIKDNILVLSKNTQVLYISNSDEGYDGDLIPVNQQRNSAGEATGSLCTERHVFTAADITAQEITLGNPVLSNAENTLVCYMNGSVHMPGEAFYCNYDSTKKLLTIKWDDDYSDWYVSSPKKDEVAIFQYYKL